MVRMAAAGQFARGDAPPVYYVMVSRSYSSQSSTRSRPRAEEKLKKIANWSILLVNFIAQIFARVSEIEDFEGFALFWFPQSRRRRSFCSDGGSGVVSAQAAVPCASSAPIAPQGAGALAPDSTDSFLVGFGVLFPRHLRIRVRCDRRAAQHWQHSGSAHGRRAPRRVPPRACQRAVHHRGALVGLHVRSGRNRNRDAGYCHGQDARPQCASFVRSRRGFVCLDCVRHEHFVRPDQDPCLSAVMCDSTLEDHQYLHG